VEHLLGIEAFETTHDLGFAAPFFQSPRRVGLGLLVPSQAYDDDAVERSIGLAVASAIEALIVSGDREKLVLQKTTSIQLHWSWPPDRRQGRHLS
jgi:hypothetical protein